MSLPGDEVGSEAAPPRTTTARLLRSSAVVSAGTALSRVTGLLRTVAIAVALTAALADAYNLANTAPNVVYDLILGGVLAATLVPVLVSVIERGDRQAVKAVVTCVTVALVVLSAVAMLAAPWIVRLYTFALESDVRAEQESVAVPLLRLFIPQVLFYGLTALYTALLNARRRFAAAAFAPALNNVLVIAVLLAVSRMASGDPTISGVLDDPVMLWLLGLGTTAGIVAMALVLVPAVRAADIPMGWNPDWRNPAVNQILRLSGWTLGYVVVTQIGLVILLALANASAGEGSLSAYSYAYLFFQLPYGLFAVSVMITFLPELSSAADRGDTAEYRDRFGLGLRLILVILVPCSVVYMAASGDMVRVLFGHGAFSDASADLTTEALTVFGAGLIGFAVVLYAMRGFYALKDTRTPFLLSVVKTGFMVIAAWPLAEAFGLAGVVGAFAGAYTLAAVVGLVLLARRSGGIAGGGTAITVAKTGLAGLVALAVALAVPSEVVGTDLMGSAAQLAVVGGAVAVSYLAVLVATRSADLAWLLDRLPWRQQ